MLRFRLAVNCTLILQRGDITKWSGDAMVNAANERMLGGGGVDGAIHRRAGPKLKEACREVPEVSRNVRCPSGEARLTTAGNLDVKFIIHTVGPIYSSAEESAPILEAAYRSSLQLAAETDGVHSVAFPALSCGVFEYPWDEAADIAVRMCKEVTGAEPSTPLHEITFSLFEEGVFAAWREAAERHLGPALGEGALGEGSEKAEAEAEAAEDEGEKAESSDEVPKEEEEKKEDAEEADEQEEDKEPALKKQKDTDVEAEAEKEAHKEL